jgi:DNA-binding response OmpR family regulator
VFAVLERNTGRVLSRAELARHAGIADLSDRRCDSLIVGIRRTIGADRVQTVRRRGWHRRVPTWSGSDTSHQLATRSKHSGDVSEI